MKRLMIAALAVVLVLSLLLPVGAAQFSDVTDVRVQTAAEVLRLMGVLDGFPDGTFRPQEALTRAQFCKMVVCAADAQSELAAYESVTVFPDVASGHWARTYVNLAAKGHSWIAGFPDGSFRPSDGVTAAQAVTILLRLLGYTDEVVGGVWPMAQMAKAENIGLLEGTGITDANAVIDRRQAATLFVQLLRSDKAEGGNYYTLGEEVTLTSIDGGAGTITVTGNKSYELRYPSQSTTLIGQRGKVVLNADGKALTFLPQNAADGELAATGVVVSSNGSVEGFALLAGGEPYTLIKNGIAATPADLRAQDTAIYAPDTKSILVSDAHLTVRYEGASPSKANPAILTTLGGAQLQVLPSAVSQLSRFEIGDQIALLLTADGQIAGVTDPQSVISGNTVCYVKDDKLNLCIGGTLVPLPGAAAELSELNGKIVRVSVTGNGDVLLKEATGSVRGAFDPQTATLGNLKLASNALILDYGERVGLSQLTQQISARSIRYFRTNWKNEVDVLVLHDGEAPIYGRITDRGTTYESGAQYTFENGTQTLTAVSQNAFEEGDFVSVVKKPDGSIVRRLQKHEKVSVRAWLNNNYLSLDGKTFGVADEACCYNAESGTWISLAQAREYYETMNVYTEGTTVYCICVGEK